MPVSSTNTLYEENYPKWVLVRDCVSGEDAIKKKSTTYLPCPGGVDPKSQDYQGYIGRAHFYMATARAADIFYGHILSQLPEQTGAPEQKDGEVNLFVELLKNVDNEGTSLDQFVSDLVWDTEQTGRSGMLVDYSHAEKTLTQAESEKLGMTSFIKRYTAESIINWRYDTVKNKNTLALVVLKESYNEIGIDEFVPVVKDRYRVLKMIGGVYHQEVWGWVKNEATKKDELVVIVPAFPTQLNGKGLDFIPFFPCPGKEPENSPLLGIAYENIGHYQKTADFENDLHYTAIHTAYILGAKQPGHYVKDADGNEVFVPEPIFLGGSKFLFFEGEGEKTPSIGYLETAGSESHLKSLQACEQRMVQMAGQSIAPEKKGVEAAATARIHRAGENSVIGSFSLNIAEQVTLAVRLAARWRGVQESIVNKWSMSFNVQYASDLTAEEKMRMAVSLVAEEVMSRKTLLMDYKGMTEEQAEQEMQRIQQERDGQYSTQQILPKAPVTNK
jgi:hypothetical protein